MSSRGVVSVVSGVGGGGRMSSACATHVHGEHWLAGGSAG